MIRICSSECISDYLYTLPYVFITLFNTASLVLSLGCLFCPSKVSSYRQIHTVIFIFIIKCYQTVMHLLLTGPASGDEWGTCIKYSSSE